MVNKRKPQRVYQHEPLVKPSNWTGEAQQFFVRLSALIDDLYQKNGRLQQRVKELEGKMNASD